MSDAKKFKFVSPGIFIKEIDKSLLDVEPEAIGPIVVGRAQRGPAGTPIKVRSYAEFVEIFGEPLPGVQRGDVFRDGNQLGPTYASYAAKAWLTNNSPLTFIRLLGEQNPAAAAAGLAGWGKATTSANSPGGAIADMLQGDLTRVEGENDSDQDVNLAGGAYALWLFNGSDQIESLGISGNTDANPATGALGAVFYCDFETTVALSGTFNFDEVSANHVVTASQAATIGTSSAGTLSLLIGSPASILSGAALTGDENTSYSKIDFDFTRGSDSFIRKVFNTNPTLVNDDITTTGKGYFLGETYEGWIDEKLGGWSNVTHGLLMGLRSREADPKEGSDFRFGRKNAHTGWFISQDTGDAANFDIESTQKLFRFISLNQGEWTQNNIKISIEDIKLPTDKFNKYGTFSVVIRSLADKDARPQVIEAYRGLNLNPDSPDYIKRRIGDKYLEWNSAESRYREYGDYPNTSKYIRVDMNEAVDVGSVGEGLVPFGVFGPYRFLNLLNFTGSQGDGTGDGADVYSNSVHAQGPLTAYHMISGDTNVGIPGTITNLFTSSIATDDSYSGERTTNYLTPGAAGLCAMSSSFYFPELALRDKHTDGDIDDARKAYWGVSTERSGSRLFDESVRDVIRALPAGIDPERDGSSNYTNVSWVFSLDNLVKDANDVVEYVSGSRRDQASNTGESLRNLSVASGSGWIANSASYNRFTTLMHGGFDGFDITEKDPLRNSLVGNGNTELTNYTYNTIKQAIQSIKDPEILEYNIATIPGMTNATLTKLLVDNCEDRGDALAIIDLENDGAGTGMYQPNTENTETEKDRVDNQDIDTVRTKLKDREINSSYGCTYYPWVQIRDDNTAAILKVPPSVVALGAMSFSEAQQAPWFAPAGFTRGGLSNGAIGLNVVGVTHKLTSEDRDKLYEANINPIATFPSEGIVVFGQKTLQVTPSALDRINVRRLLILLKKEVSNIAATTLFEQNQQATWLNFSTRVKRFLTGVKSQLGLTDFKVVLDETTTTPDLIDRNVMYAKIFLKPARSIEFIALDFIIADSGASFED